MTSKFIAEAINAKLAALRHECALQRWHLSSAFGRRWSGCERNDPANPSSSDLYWENLQAEAQLQRPKDVAKADKDLADFIAEHRHLMPDDWIGNDHGRLCWAHYLGGRPITMHYCQLHEGHEGKHCNHLGAWLQGVTNASEHRALPEVQP